MASDHESETTGVDVMQDLGLFIDLCFFFFLAFRGKYICFGIIYTLFG